LADLVATLQELADRGVGFVSLSEALDMTTATGRAMAGLLALFSRFEHNLLRERVRAGLAEARLNDKQLCPASDPRSPGWHRPEAMSLPSQQS
jgi:putative DNA-invertase from lambdoid prophage Rac